MAPRPSDAADIAGSASLEIKDMMLQSFNRHWWTREGPLFGTTLTRGIDLTSVSLDDDVECPVPGRKIFRLVCDLEVIEEMCDNLGNMHGGCIAFLIDGISSNVFIGMNEIAVSLNLNFSFFAPAKRGSRIRMVNTAVATGGYVVMARAQVFDIASGTLLFTGDHAKMRPSAAPTTFPLLASASKPAKHTSKWKPHLRITDRQHVPGSAPSDLKASVWDLIEHWETGGPFALNIGKTVRLTEVNVETLNDRSVTSAICEMEVYTSMLNLYHNLHGGCASFLIYRLTAILRDAISGAGPSVKLDMNFHAPAVEGVTIRIVISTVSAGKRVCSTRAEIFEAKSGRLLVSGTHTQLQPGSPKPSTAKL